MTGIGLATKGKICQQVSVESSSGVIGGAVIYRDRYKTKKSTKKECELLYFPKINTSLVDIMMGEDKEFSIVVISVKELVE